MNNRFDAFLMAVMVILTLILIEIAGGVYYQQLKRSGSAYTRGTGTDVPAVSKHITIGTAR